MADYVRSLSDVRFNKYGGYVSNQRGSVFWSPSLDRKDGQEKFLRILEKDYMTSQMKADYYNKGLGKHKVEQFKGPVFFGKSGYEMGTTYHKPSAMATEATTRAYVGSTVNSRATVTPQCLPPLNSYTEYNEQFNRDYGSREPRDMYGPGCRDNGYTKSLVGWSPATWRMLDPSFEYSGQFPKNTVQSVSHCDFRPNSLKTGDERFQPISSKGNKRYTGYTIANELKPSFEPPATQYGQRDPAHDDPGRFVSTKQSDYYWKSGTCDTTGLRIVGQGPSFTASSAVGSLVNFDYGHGSSYKTEAKERFFNPWPLQGSRSLWLEPEVNRLTPSGFSLSTKVHSSQERECKDRRWDLMAGGLLPEPQRYNPWKRSNLNHQALMYNDFRPNPIENSQLAYTISAVEPAISNEPTTVLY